MANTAFDHHQHFTYGDYLNWPENERWELIDGVAYNMTPAPSILHQRISGEIYAQLHALLKGNPCEPFHAPFDVRLPDHNQADDQISTVVQPDLAVICDEAKLDDKGCRGAPDFIIEIISPSTAAKDQMTKTALYEQHKVREYWIVHPHDQLLTIRVLDDSGRYPAPRITELENKVAVTSLPGLEIDLDPVGLLCQQAAKEQDEEPSGIERRI